MPAEQSKHFEASAPAYFPESQIPQLEDPADEDDPGLQTLQNSDPVDSLYVPAAQGVQIPLLGKTEVNPSPPSFLSWHSVGESVKGLLKG